jgi:hypothetical protein
VRGDNRLLLPGGGRHDGCVQEKEANRMKDQTQTFVPLMMPPPVLDGNRSLPLVSDGEAMNRRRSAARLFRLSAPI